MLFLPLAKFLSLSFFGLVLLLSQVSLLFTAATISIPSELESKLVSGDQYLEYISDTHNKITIEQLLQGAYQDEFIAVNSPLIPASMSQFWLRLQLLNADGSEQYSYLVLNTEHTKRVQVYQQGKLLAPASEARTAAYALHFAAHENQTLYIRVEDRNDPLSLQMELVSARQMTERIGNNNILIGLVLGGGAVLALYNLLVFLRLREPTFFFLAISSFLLGLELLRMDGFLGKMALFDTYYPAIGAMPGYLIVASSCAFFYYSLSIGKHFPRHAYLLQVVFWVSICFSMLAPWLPLRSVLVALLGSFLISLIIPMTWKLYKRGVHAVRTFIITVFVLLVFSLPVIYSALRAIETATFMQPVYLSIVVFMLVLSLTLTERTRKSRERIGRIHAAGEAKTEFLATMSHELRGPMNSVIAASTLLKRTKLDLQQQEYITRQETAARHMLGLVDNILDLSRIEHSFVHLSCTPFRIQSLLDEIQQVIETPAVNKGLQFKLNVTVDSDFYVMGDYRYLSRILLNLLDNAVKFTNKGQVELVVKQLPIEHVGHCLLYFEVSDTGIGISPKDTERLFHPFSPLESHYARQYSGSGLGLVISQRLVELMGGELELESQVGEGSRLFFTLEFSFEALAAVPTKSSISYGLTLDTSALQAKQVLLVDDDEMNQFFCRSLLKMLELEISFASSGYEAIEMLQQQRFDLIFMDISMPGMDGYETTRHLRARHGYSLPIVALTAHAISGERERCLAAGMDDYLTKPVELEHLYATLQHWIGERSALKSAADSLASRRRCVNFR